MKILVSGSLVFDRIMNFPGRFADHILPDKIHEINLCFQINAVKDSFGGTAGNIAYNLKMLGLEPIILSAVGSDFNDYKDWLIKNNINLNFIRVLPQELTSRDYILTDEADNQITAFHPGAMEYQCGVKEFLPEEKYLAIVSPGNLKDMVEYPAIYQKMGIDYIFDPGQAIPLLSVDDLLTSISGAKILISNDYELEMILKKTRLIFSEIRERVEVIITTMGDHGSRITTSDEEMAVPAAKPLGVIDPTGAGDGYRAGLIKGLVENYDLRNCARLGGVVALYTVEKYGTQTHEFNWEEVLRRFKENYQEKN